MQRRPQTLQPGNKFRTFLNCERLEDRLTPALAVTEMTSITATDLVNEILGSGVTVDTSSIHFVGKTGTNSSAGIFTGGNGIIGFNSGIILSTGYAVNVIGPNNSTGVSGTVGTGSDTDLATLTSASLDDTTSLEFDFTPSFSTLTFNYVFSSEEYNEFVGGSFNDVFGFFVNGQNQALLPTSSTSTKVVSINNVNLNTNSQYYVNNSGTGSANLNTQMDGLTVVLTVTAAVNPGVTNHIKMAIADAGDTSYDSDVFIEANSFGGGVQVVESGGNTAVTEGGNTDSYTIALASQPTADVTLTIDGGTQLRLSTNGTTFTQIITVTFTPTNWNTPQTITVQAFDDTIIEGPHTGTIHTTASSTDLNYNNINISDITVAITDNDFPVGAVTITESGGSTQVAEGGATDDYTVVLTVQPNSNVTINMNPGTQLAVSPSSLVFTPQNYNVPQTVTVSAIDDSIIEGNHSGTISHTISTTSSNYVNVLVASVVAQITDNDFGAVIFNPPPNSPLALLEGKSRTYTAVLNVAPTSDVTVNISPDPQLTVSPSSLVFTPDNWKVPQTVNVTAIDNSIIDGNRTVLIGHSISTTDGKYTGSTVADMPVNIIDDENTLVVNGGESVDNISVLFNTSNIQVILNSKSTFYGVGYSQVLVLGNGGNDNITLANPTIPVAVLGGGGTDKLTINGQAASNDFSVDATSVTVNGHNVTLGDVESVLLNGKNNADTMTVQVIPAYSLTFQGGSGMDRVIGPDQDTTWKFTASNGGSLAPNVLFTSVENFTGGSGNDTFMFGATTAISGQIDGGGGSNSLNYSANKSGITVNLQTNSVNLTKSFANIASIVGGSGLADKIIGANASNTWNITGWNTGDINGLGFTGFENLTGGNQYDTFVLTDGAGLKGKIDGGLGAANQIDYSAVQGNITVNLQTKTATNTGGFLNIQQFLGGAGTDTLIGANKAQTWTISGNGQGTITGGYTFQNFENLTGGSLADLFNVDTSGGWSGMLNGGVGTDSIVATSGGSYTMSGTNAGTLNGNSFKNVEKHS